MICAAIRFVFASDAFDPRFVEYCALHACPVQATTRAHGVSQIVTLQIDAAQIEAIARIGVDGLFPSSQILVEPVPCRRI